MVSGAGFSVEFRWNASADSLAESAVRKQIGRSGFLSLAEKAKEKMEPFVPMDTGALIKSAYVWADDLRGRVCYGAPYASAVYYGGNMSYKRDKHPLATAYWDREVRWR